MPASTLGGLPITGRKSSAVARKRLSILLAAQSVFATKGTSAAIEDIALEAEVSVSTLYKHFANKEDLFQAAFQQAFITWESWVAEVLPNEIDLLAGLVMPMRLIVRSKETHPLFAKMLSNNLGEVSGQLRTFSDSLIANLKSVSKVALVSESQINSRAELVMTILLHLVQKRILNSKYSAADADREIAIAIQMLGIDEQTGEKLIAMKLPLHLQAKL